ncbi:hypothetical protein MPLDJ20_140334 [Mesorhizobium plurifarium]|uniref:Uncharacterized protein n=1 Tax=Mesorhizobium plurifarium TaxID=69974 RepID=A0A090ERI9_MESPL|nr:hypothetical protein MPLDJ20_140334 [Mesorhizobium plurifarium]
MRLCQAQLRTISNSWHLVLPGNFRRRLSATGDGKLTNRDVENAGESGLGPSKELD